MNAQGKQILLILSIISTLWIWKRLIRVGNRESHRTGITSYGMSHTCGDQISATVIWVTAVCLWPYDSDHFNMFVTESFCVEKSVADISNLSPTKQFSNICHHHKCRPDFKFTEMFCLPSYTKEARQRDSLSHEVIQNLWTSLSLLFGGHKSLNTRWFFREFCRP